MRGPHYRGFTADGTKTLFRLPGSRGSITRLVVAEAPIDALSFAALERIRTDTLYVATGGGMGPGTIAGLNELLAELATRANPLMVIATDADGAGERYASQLSEIAGNAHVPVQRAQPPDGLNDWNDVIKAQAGRGVR
jgi:Toprim-like